MGSPVSLCDGGLDVRRLVIGKSNGDLSSRETTEEDVFSGEEEEEEREWCGENRYCFYFVKQFAYDDPEIKAKIDEADNEIYNCNSERIHISNRLKAKRAERLAMESLMDQEGNSLTERLSEIKMEMELLDAQMSCVLDQRDRAFERIKFLRIQRDKGNAAFYQSRVVMKKAIELAASGNVRDLEELANSEVDKFMSRWNNDKAFREDYKKRILPSLEKRKLRRRVDTEDRDETAIELKRFSTEEEEEESDEKLQKEEEENLKEKKREEQLAKARQAMERKRKLHEKTAAKAAIKAKKEAEKKLKELEKRAKKKKKSSSSPSETVTEASEPEKKPLNGRTVSWNHRSFLRYRHHKKGNESVPKAILKRRRAYRLWVWSVSSAAIALPLALSILFFYVR